MTATGNLFNIIIFNHEGVHSTLGFHFLSKSSLILSLYSFLKFIERMSHFHIPQFFITGKKCVCFFVFIFSRQIIVPVISQVLNKCVD